jgi:hypothetical protein
MNDNDDDISLEIFAFFAAYNFDNYEDITKDSNIMDFFSPETNNMSKKLRTKNEELCDEEIECYSLALTQLLLYFISTN